MNRPVKTIFFLFSLSKRSYAPKTPHNQIVFNQATYMPNKHSIKSAIKILFIRVMLNFYNIFHVNSHMTYTLN